jgi:hypothetical protein
MDPSETAPPAHSRIIRSFALREDAARARAALEDAGIACTVREYRVPDALTREMKTRALNLCIAPADARAAGRIMLRLPPSDAPVAATAKPEGPTRLRRGAVRGGRQKSSVFMIGFAVLCAAGMIMYGANAFFGLKKGKVAPHSTFNILIEEDLNYDGTPDVIREFTWNHIPIHHNEDRNFDGEMDVRWIWQRGKPAYRDMDINFDGKFDDHTVYNPDSQPFYTDIRPGGKGAVRHRRVFRQGVPWKNLEDYDGDNHFDHLTELDDLGNTVREEDLPKGHAENSPPVWPVPPWPERDEEEKVIEKKP